MIEKSLTEERIDGPTPQGGAYSIAYYRDENGELIDKAVASRVEIVEYDSRGNMIWRTYGTLDANR
jgi:hypothetical protein